MEPDIKPSVLYDDVLPTQIDCLVMGEGSEEFLVRMFSHKYDTFQYFGNKSK